MNKLNALAALPAAFAGLTLVAAPTVSNVSLSQPSPSKVEIVYDLSENAVVTIDILTNDVSIGQTKLVHLSGAVNKTVAAGTGKKITWNAFKDWPDGDAVNARAVVNAWSLDAPPPYCAVSLEVPGDIFFYAAAEAVPGGVTDNRYKKEFVLLRKIPAAGVTWRMGTPYVGETCTIPNEYPHHVTFTKDYYIGVYEFTRAQYMSFRTDWAGNDGQPSRDWSASNWFWPIAAIPQVYRMTVLPGFVTTRCGSRMTFRLPTDAEWEYAARAGNGEEYADGTSTYKTDSRYFADNDSTIFPKNTRVDVGTTTYPNAWGLYDMSGNVMEQVSDLYRVSLTEAETDPTGPDPATYEGDKSSIWRGGSYGDGLDWNTQPYRRSVALAHRKKFAWDDYGGFDMGFRIAAPAVVTMPAAQ